MNPSSTPSLEATEGSESVDLQFAYRVLDSMHAQVRIADEKIRALFSGSALLAAALAFNAGRSYVAVAANGVTSVELLWLGVRALLLLTVSYSLIAAILALLPRIVPRRSVRSLFFFGHIATTDHDRFLTEFPALSKAAALEQIVSQIHVNSAIVQAKYSWTRRASTAFIAAILIWLVVQILEFAI